MVNHLRTGARLLLWCEPFLLLVTGYFFWFPSNFPFFEQFGHAQPIDRADYVWLLLLLLPVYAARYVVHGRVLTLTPLVPWMGLFVALGLLNTQVAPFESRGPLMLARPLFGMAIVIYFTERAQADGHVGVPLRIMLGLALLFAVVALTTTQWNPKAADFQFIIDGLPRLRWFPFGGGFNPNEIAGALAWFVPLAGSLVFYPWRRAEDLWRTVALFAFVGLLLALVLGQSRSAILGTVIGLCIAAAVAVPKGRYGLNRAVAYGGIGLLVMVQLGVLFNVFPLEINLRAQEPAPAVQAGSPGGAQPAAAQGDGDDGGGPAVGLSARDTETLDLRLNIFEGALAIILDHPLTGAGMDRFRALAVRREYPIEGFNMPIGASDYDPTFPQPNLPHAHNEFLQAGTDLGVPGMVVFVAWYASALWMLWVCWRDGDEAARVAAVAILAGLVAHGAYGLSDAITLWDRFSFLFWMMLGLASAQYVAVRAVARQPQPV